MAEPLVGQTINGLLVLTEQYNKLRHRSGSRRGCTVRCTNCGREFGTRSDNLVKGIVSCTPCKEKASAE